MGEHREHRRPPLASSLVDMIAATLDEELGTGKKGGGRDTRDIARRIAIDVLDEIERRGLRSAPRRPPFGPGGPFGGDVMVMRGPGGWGGPGRWGGPPPPPPPPPDDEAPPPPPGPRRRKG